ncbi:putative RNA binding protein YcfA (HicA-like mRNA interferase family) [Amycolatopsis sulphurea]|uniref:Putative RNA binding protein YcfA (HicA-like mRNA interferase family) n=1 Tax=Amycolatopsis sulphurea TaxID=76022 RepID=A0A2A9FE83_9PSEU|nr:type II toxin-antitoxin system HicA family toxin [Amycolatopsis sulphurea]PFG49086.1 putative RNA binding protein YcfA (HicA-like mRNA interferase family) [Amycolatopsis sulphurea]
MVGDQPTRKMVKALRATGFQPVRTVGSHTMGKSEDGKVQIAVPDGHRTISAGVARKILKAIEEAEQ